MRGSGGVGPQNWWEVKLVGGGLSKLVGGWPQKQVVAGRSLPHPFNNSSYNSDLDSPGAGVAIIYSDSTIAEGIAKLASRQCTERCDHLRQSNAGSLLS